MWVDIVPREIWGASLPTFSKTLNLPAKYVFCMSTFTLPCVTDESCIAACQGAQAFAMEQKGYNDIRFNFIIGGKGQIYEGRGWYVSPLLPVVYSSVNSKSILLGFIGYYTERTLPKVMRDARDELVNHGLDKNFIAEDFQSFKILGKHT